jgi:hypothetical protein
MYLSNTHGTDTMFGVSVFVNSQPTGDDDVAIGLDPAGVGNGSSTGVALTIADEDDSGGALAAGGVTFTVPTDVAPLNIGDLAPGEAAAVWVRRNIPALSVNTTLNDQFVLGITMYG